MMDERGYSLNTVIPYSSGLLIIDHILVHAIVSLKLPDPTQNISIKVAKIKIAISLHNKNNEYYSLYIGTLNLQNDTAEKNHHSKPIKNTVYQHNRCMPYKTHYVKRPSLGLKTARQTPSERLQSILSTKHPL